MEDTPKRNDELVPPEAVVAPRRAQTATALRPEHLYKTAGLLFLLALIYHYLPQIIRVFLLAYAAVILAVLFNSLAQRIPIQRKWVAGLLGIVILSGMAGITWVGVPVLIGEVRDLAGRAPEFVAQLRAAEQWIRSNTGLNIELVGPSIQERLRNFFLSTEAGGTILSTAQGIVGILLIPLLVLFGALYVVANPNHQLLSPILRAVPRDRRLAFRRIFQLLGDRLIGWVQGVLLGMIAVGILSFILFYLIGVPNALLLAVISMLTEAIPLLGPWIGGGIATIVAFLEDPTKGLWTALAALAVQQIENNLLIPWAMSRSAEVHPFVTLFALVLFGTLFGFLGILLAIPLVLLIWTLVEVLWVERAIDTDEDPIRPLVQE